MKFARIALAALALAVAATPSSARWKLFESDAQRDDDYCRSLGAARGTNSYIQCRLARDGQRQQMIEGINQTLQQGQIRNQQMLEQVIRPLPHTYNCTTTYLGYSAHTTCY